MSDTESTDNLTVLKLSNTFLLLNFRHFKILIATFSLQALYVTLFDHLNDRKIHAHGLVSSLYTHNQILGATKFGMRFL